MAALLVTTKMYDAQRDVLVLPSVLGGIVSTDAVAEALAGFAGTTAYGSTDDYEEGTPDHVDPAPDDFQR